MSGFQCPFCSMVMSLNYTTRSSKLVGFYYANNATPTSGSQLELVFYQCPNCLKYSITVRGVGHDVSDVPLTWIRPQSSARKFPEYVPEAIRIDYEEACAIVNLSPKSSATLARRCLQGMIRDFWGIRKNRLIDEIDALQGQIPAQQWAVIDGVRRIGNIGAHMEKDINTIIDIEPGEAQKLIKLIELLITQWYVNRHAQEQLYADILDIDQAKQDERKGTE